MDNLTLNLDNSSLSWNSLTKNKSSLMMMMDNLSTILNNSSILLNNSTRPEDQESVPLPAWLLLLHLVVRVIEGLLALTANALTVITISRYETLQNTSNYLIVGLSVADIVSGVSIIPIVVKELLPDPLTYHILCLIEQSLNALSVILNLLTICLIAVERYFFIDYPLRYATIVTMRSVKYALASTWIFSTTQTGILLYVMGVTFSEERTCDSRDFLAHPAALCISRIEFGILTIITFVCYGKIASIALQQSRMLYPFQVGDEFHMFD